MKRKLRILHLTDLHIGHNNNNPQFIYENVFKIVYPRLQDIDFLILGGDFFHTLISLNEVAGFYATTIISDLLHLAKEYGFYIRVLRGTFSHDRNQNRMFESLTEYNDIKIDDIPIIKVINNISVEIFPKKNISFAYIPDDQPYDDLGEALKDVLKTHNLPAVDILVSHSYYAHLLIPNIPIPHNTLYYDKIKNMVKCCMLNGHVHTRSIYHNVINTGSFERMCHGEEEPKGFTIVNYDTSSKEKSFEFVENTNTYIYKTLDMRHTDNVEEARDIFNKYADTIKDKLLLTNSIDNGRKVYIRLLINDVIIKQVIEDYGLSKYKNIVFSSKKQEHIESKDNIIVSVSELPIITPDNLSTMIYNDCQKDNVNDISLDFIKEFIDG